MMKKLPKWLKIFLIILGALLVVVLLIPSIVSLGPARALALKQINKIHGLTVSIDDWRLGWRGPLRVSGITVEQEPAAHLHVEEIHVSKGLGGFIVSPFHFGDVLVSGITLEAHQPEVAQKPPGKEPDVETRAPVGGRRKSPPVDTAKKEPPALLPLLEGRIQVEKMTVVLVETNGNRQVLLNAFEATLIAGRGQERLRLTAEGEGGVGIGTISLDARAFTEKTGSIGPEDVSLASTVTIPSIALEPVTAFAASLSGAPRMDGDLSFAAECLGSLAEGLQFGAHLNAANLAIHEPAARIGSIRANMKGTATTEALTLDTLEIRSPFLTIHGSGTLAERPQEKISLTATGVLDSLHRLLHEVGALPEETSFEGQMQAHLDLGIQDQQLRVAMRDTGLRNVNLRVDDKQITDQDVTVEADLTAGVQGAEIQSLKLGFSAGEVSLGPSRMTADGQLQADVRAAIDLAKLVENFASMLGMPDDLALAGVATTDGALSGSTRDRLNIDTDIKLSNLKVIQDGNVVVEEPSVDLGARATYAMSGALTLQKLHVTSAPLRANLAGTLIQGPDGLSIDLQGMLGPNFNRVSQYLSEGLDIPVTLAGDAEKPVRIRGDRIGNVDVDPLERIEVSAAMQLDTFSGYGMRVANLDVPLNLREGTMRVDITAGVNEGTLEVYPEVTLTGETSGIRMPNEAQLLSNVALTPEMANDLLSLLHPLFKGASSAEGTIDLTMHRFYWPLDPTKKNEAAFEGRIGFNDIRLGVSGMVQTTLDLLKVKEQVISIGNKEITFSCKDGKITCSPLKFRAGDYRMVVSGSMTLDSQLDYIVEVPLTEELLGKSGTKYLKGGTTVRLPIRGPAARPRIDSHALNKAIAEVGTEALKNVIEQKGKKLLEELFN